MNATSLKNTYYLKYLTQDTVSVKLCCLKADKIIHMGEQFTKGVKSS